MKNEMLSLADASARIAAGDIMTIAGSEELLRALPKGNWIGGTTVYFITETGGAVVRDRVFCTSFNAALSAVPRHLGVDALSSIAQGYVEGGFSIILIPAFCAAHQAFAIHGQAYAGLFDQPLAGWITGVHLDEIGTRKPLVFDGATGIAHEEGAVLLHVSLPEHASVDLDILNIFRPGAVGDLSCRFAEDSFAVTTATVNGQEVNFARYLDENKIDTRLPLIANYAGALVNVSVQSVDVAAGKVAFFAPVVAGVEYRLAARPDSYVRSFAEAAAGKGAGQYSCNCILNYLYGELEGKQTGEFTGPVTFGEIAYILLNQTLVRLGIQMAA
jgi:hypothetical protein